MRSLLAVTLLLSGSAMATTMNWVPVDSSPADEVSLIVDEVATPPEVEKAIRDLVPKTGGLSEEMVIIDQIINLGQKIWTIIEKNQPVLNVKYQYANAVPKGVRSAEELENFSALQSRSFRMHGKNGFGSNVYDVTYTLVHRYGGTYQGKGRYLDAVTVLPSKVSALWGYKVDFACDRVSAANSGTRENPIASVLLELSFKVSTVVKKTEYRGVYEFRGDSPRVGTTN